MNVFVLSLSLRHWSGGKLSVTALYKPRSRSRRITGSITGSHCEVESSLAAVNKKTRARDKATQRMGQRGAHSRLQEPTEFSAAAPGPAT